MDSFTAIYIICLVCELAAIKNQETHYLSELEEVLGQLHSVETSECGLIAVIGKIRVRLPKKLSRQLKGLIGRRIGILRLEGYHLRCLENEDDA